ncbi:MAG: hypothetical protein G01um1014106_616, partial [Parcubacteria group bacterium Gr01-1014_106]
QLHGDVPSHHTQTAFSVILRPEAEESDAGLRTRESHRVFVSVDRCA